MHKSVHSNSTHLQSAPHQRRKSRLLAYRRAAIDHAESHQAHPSSIQDWPMLSCLAFWLPHSLLPLLTPPRLDISRGCQHLLLSSLLPPSAFSRCRCPLAPLCRSWPSSTLIGQPPLRSTDRGISASTRALSGRYNASCAIPAVVSALPGRTWRARSAAIRC